MLIAFINFFFEIPTCGKHVIFVTEFISINESGILYVKLVLKRNFAMVLVQFFLL